MKKKFLKWLAEKYPWILQNEEVQKAMLEAYRKGYNQAFDDWGDFEPCQKQTKNTPK